MVSCAECILQWAWVLGPYHLPVTLVLVINYQLIMINGLSTNKTNNENKNNPIHGSSVYVGNVIKILFRLATRTLTCYVSMGQVATDHARGETTFSPGQDCEESVK